MIRQQQQQPIDKRPKVRFAVSDDETDSPALYNNKFASSRPLYETLTLDTCNDELWYHKDEINAFKRDVANILILYGSNKANNINNVIIEHNKDMFCGLERHNIQRASAKKNAIRLVLSAQNLHYGSEFLRRVSREMSEQARDMARVQGFGDFCNVYYCNEALVPSTTTSSTSSSKESDDDGACKRRATTTTSPDSRMESIDPERRVRQRHL